MNILVTGASSGIGAAVCEDLIKQGHVVVAAARRIKKHHKLKAKLGGSLAPVQVDVTDRDAVCSLQDILEDQVVSVDVIVNAAGLALGVDMASSAKFDEWAQMVETNVTGMLSVVHTFLPDMVARGAGDVINIGSIAGSYAYPGGNVYGASKAFVRHFTLNLRADLAGTGVRATDIQPGLVTDTEFFSVRFRGDEGKATAASQDFRGLRPVDVAKAVRWVISQPSHVNINQLEIMPTDQSFSALTLHRKPVA